jgi:hypothetical protein
MERRQNESHRGTRLGETNAIDRRKRHEMSYETLRDLVCGTLARLHAAVDAGDCARALRTAVDGMLRDGRRRASSDRRLRADERAELHALLDQVERLRALLPSLRAVA